MSESHTVLEQSPIQDGHLSKELLDEIVRRIIEVAAPEQIILFGSAARGEMGPDSDVDLLVIKSGIHRRKTAWSIRQKLMGIGTPKEWLRRAKSNLAKAMQSRPDEVLWEDLCFDV